MNAQIDDWEITSSVRLGYWKEVRELDNVIVELFAGRSVFSLDWRLGYNSEDRVVTIH